METDSRPSLHYESISMGLIFLQPVGVCRSIAYIIVFQSPFRGHNMDEFTMQEITIKVSNLIQFNHTFSTNITTTANDVHSTMHSIKQRLIPP